MSFAKVGRKQFLKCRSNRLGASFVKRILDKGQLIDRNQTTRPKNVKTVQAPSILVKFFTPPTNKDVES